jgi:dsRNA-specific ribonuclease
MLTWQDSTTGPTHAPEWTSLCKSEYFFEGTFPSSHYPPPSLVRGHTRGVGTGTHKHLARNVAAKAALEALTNEEA